MQIKLYKNLSDKKEINKYKVLIAQEAAKLLEPSSMQDPTLTLKLSNSEAGDLNYIEIPDFNRFYYVVDKTSIANGVWSITCSCDVLESFKDAILNLDAVIERQESVYNVYQPDEEFNVYSNPVLETWAFNYFEDNAYYLATAQAAGTQNE